VEKLLDVHGASFALTSPLQRFRRDLSVGTRHPQFNPFITTEDYGRIRFKVEKPMMLAL